MEFISVPRNQDLLKELDALLGQMEEVRFEFVSRTTPTDNAIQIVHEMARKAAENARAPVVPRKNA